MAHVFEKIDAQLAAMDRQRVVPAGIYLSPNDLQEMVEDLDAGQIHADPDGAYRELIIHEAAGSKSYIFTAQGDKIFIDLMVDWPA